MIRIGIVDDHAIVRSGLRQFLSENVDLRVTGEASNGREALDLVRGGGMVPTAYGMRAARAEQAAGVASKLTISLRPLGAAFGAAGEDGSASAAERHAADAAATEIGEAEAAGAKKKKKGRRKKK